MMNDLEREMAEAEARDSEYSVELSKPVELSKEVEEKVHDYLLGKTDAEGSLATLTNDVAKRLNLGLMNEYIKLLLNLSRQKEKVEALEKLIYSKEGVNYDKDLVNLYKYEQDAYVSKLEFVRKYVLNNKAALDEANGDTNELAQILSQLPKNKIAKIKEYLTKLNSEVEVSNEDLLDGEGEE